ncbi:hypothetical protein [Aquihabitans sp. McL0605]|uniref:hypothetical protein n=1 Tax=Aquihabitans sp. McL0605 TaxID=3415671 RepID=UPI003CF7A493
MIRRALDWAFRNRETGRITIAQAPNLALATFLVAVVIRRLSHPGGDLGTLVTVVATAAIGWWAIDEIVRGVNPWRRALGSVVLVLTLWGVVAG